MTLKTTRQGKRYKDWLFARTEMSDDAPLDIIQGGATLLMRDVVRELLRREYTPRMMLSLNTPVCGTGDEALTLEDLLPGSVDPAQVAAENEYRELAAKHAEEIFAGMARLEQVVLFVREIGLPFTHEAVESVAGCKKSSLHNVHRGFIEDVAHKLEAEYPDDDRESVYSLVIMTLRELKAKIYQWGMTDDRMRDLMPIQI